MRAPRSSGSSSAVPQLIWLSEHKALVFGVAAACSLLSGVMLWNARRLPCPTDPATGAQLHAAAALSHDLWASLRSPRGRRALRVPAAGARLSYRSLILKRPGPRQREGDRGDEIHALQLERPAALLALI